MKPIVIIAIAVACSVVAVGGVLVITMWHVSNSVQEAFKIDMTQPPGGPENAGALGSEHSHAGILVKIFGDEFDFSAPAYQIKSPWIHFESRDGSTVHKHATGVELEYLFNSLSIGIDDQCYVFPDGKSFCTDDDYSLKYFINGESVLDIRDYEIEEDDKILITFGGETDEQIQEYLNQLDNQELIK
jgi:hypothetical protein